jgi:uncharacterized Zn-binding protein involved in type VI secretion
MPNDTSVNGQTVIHKDSGGVVVTSPDVCLTPVGNGVVPIPYVNVARSIHISNGSKTVTVNGNPVMLKDSRFSESSGNEPGTAGGISSGVSKGGAKFINYSCDVFFEGKPVCRRLDPMVSNLSGSGNTPPAPLMQPNVETEDKLAGRHILTMTLEFEHPSTIDGRVRQIVPQAGYTISGPETYESEKGEKPGVLQEVGTAGSYSITFAFDRSKKRLEAEK